VSTAKQRHYAKGPTETESRSNEAKVDEMNVGAIVGKKNE
jgi:hypothetical protein